MSSAQPHKVFLQKRSLSGEMKTQAGAGAGAGVACSLCPDTFPGAKELGLHILAAHCGAAAEPRQQEEAESAAAEEEAESVVVDGTPGLFMEVDVVEKTVVKATPTTISPRQQPQQQQQQQGQPPALNLPRQPTAHEVKQQFMIYRLSDTSSRYICLICDKMYTSRHNIRMHMNMHSGNNVHKCGYCGRHFAHKHVFESHVRTHTGERPFSCGKCERRFGDRSNCSSHRKRCTGVLTAPTPPDSPVPAPSHAPAPRSPVQSLRPGRSINIAPNVSITPITKPKKLDTSDTSESGIFDNTDPELDPDNVEEEENDDEGFDPQIVSVQSMIEGNPEDDFVNMGYTGEEEEDADDDLEEMMIEPDISLEYDDIEEADEPISTAQKPVSTSIFTCSFCNVKYSQQPMLLEHLTTHIDIPSEPSQTDIEQGYMVIYFSSRPKFMCLSCGKLFATAESVCCHLSIHTEENIYACEHCDKIFAHKHVYESHRKLAHPGTGPAAPGQDFLCSFCNNVFPNAVSLGNHVRVCKLRPREITPLSGAELAGKMILQIQTPVTPDTLLVATNNNSQQQQPAATRRTKPKANRPPPKLIQLNSDSEGVDIKKEVIDTEDHIVIQDTDIKMERLDADEVADQAEVPGRYLTIAPKPTMTLLSEEAKKIFASSAPAPARRSSSSNPRAHRIVETENGREYIPDTNSNNILALDGIHPPPDASEFKKGYMLRGVGPGGQQRYICVDCGKHYTTSYNVRMHRNIHLGRNLYNCKFCNKEFSHKHVWEVSETLF